MPSWRSCQRWNTARRYSAAGARLSSSSRQLHSADLPAARLRQLGEELDLARVLVRRGHALTWSWKLAHERVAAGMSGAQHDERLHDLPAVRVGLPDDRALRHRRVLEQGALDLERPDPVAGGDDHVVGAAGEPEVAVLVAQRPGRPSRTSRRGSTALSARALSSSRRTASAGGRRSAMSPSSPAGSSSPSSPMTASSWPGRGETHRPRPHLSPGSCRPAGSSRSARSRPGS